MIASIEFDLIVFESSKEDEFISWMFVLGV